MSTIRFGIVGVGNMGSLHCAYMKDVPDAQLAAVCDIDQAKRDKFASEFSVPGFATHQELLASKTCDAIVIAVPHYHHPPIALDALTVADDEDFLDQVESEANVPEAIRNGLRALY